MSSCKGKKAQKEQQSLEALRGVEHDRLIEDWKERHRTLNEKYRDVLRKLKEADDRLSAFLDVESIVAGASPVRMRVKAQGRPGESTAVLMLSDWHLEERVDPKTVNGLNEYNPEIAERRAKLAFTNGLSMIDMYRHRSRIDTLVLAVLGDMITNTIHDDLAETNYMSPSEAILKVFSLLCGGIDFLLANGNFEEILIPCCFGNHGRCHDDQTELLTRSGWKKWNEISVGQEVATYRMEDGQTEWQPLLDVYVDHYDGPMYHAKTKTADFCVTPRHRMVLCDSYKERAKIVEMQDIVAAGTQGSNWFPKFAKGFTTDLVGISDEEIELCGWVLTDGSYNRRGDDVSVHIYQSKEAGVSAIRGLLAKLRYTVSEYCRTRKAPVICGRQVKTVRQETDFYIHKHCAARLLRLLPDKHHLPEWVWKLSQRQVAVLLRAAMKGDGAAGRGRYHGELHGRRDFLDEMQALLVVNGISSRVRTNSRNEPVLSIRSSRKMFINDWDEEVSKIHYSGVIWCGEVKNGTLITRRNGIPLISGNTTKKPRVATAAKNSYEWLMYHFLAKWYERESRVKFQIADGYLLRVDVYDTILRMHHGNGIKYQGGVGGVTIPLNKAIGQWNKAWRANVDCLGHWHTMMQGRDYMINGSGIGFNAYSIQIKADFEKPQQTLFLVHPERGKTAMDPIFLE